MVYLVPAIVDVRLRIPAKNLSSSHRQDENFITEVEVSSVS